MSVQDLRPNSQDISAFYLANIYQILADSNAIPPTSIPSTVSIPPQFSPPRYAVWVNSLWSLSLVISLTCALLATSLHQWARRYIRFTQPPRRSPEKRARVRAFFADGVNKMHLPWAVEALPALIHLSLFLFFSGLAVFLFNINHSVYISVIWWIGLFSIVYVWITVMPIFRHDSPYYAPLSSIAWSLHASTLYALFTILTFITSGICGSMQTFRRFHSLSKHYGDWMLGGVRKAAEEAALKQSQEIDLGILDWTIDALGEDDRLEKFFDAIPGFTDSQMVKALQRPLPDMFRSRFVDSLCGLLDRTLLSKSVYEDVKIRRLVICMNAANAVCGPYDIYGILRHLSRLRFDQAPQSIQAAQVLARWCTSSEDYVSRCARQTVASILLSVRERDDRWTALVKDQFGLPEHVLRDNIAHGDNSVLLSILIHVARGVIRSEPSNLEILWSLTKFDVHNTQPGLQNEICALWNEVVLKARDEFYPHVFVLVWIRHLYIALHQDTDAAPIAFSASTAYGEPILAQPSSYPLCNIATHHPNISTHDPVTASPIDPRPTHLSDSSSHQSRLENPPTASESTAPRRAEEQNIIQVLPVSAHYVPPPPHVHGFPLPSSMTNPLHIDPQFTSVTVPSIHDGIEKSSPGIHPIVSMEVSHHLPQSALSNTGLTAQILLSDKPTPDTQINEMGETSQMPAATQLTFLRPEPVPIAISGSTVPGPPSYPVHQPGSFPETLKPIPPAHPLYTLDSAKEGDITIRHAVSDITEI